MNVMVAAAAVHNSIPNGQRLIQWQPSFNCTAQGVHVAVPLSSDTAQLVHAAVPLSGCTAQFVHAASLFLVVLLSLFM